MRINNLDKILKDELAVIRDDYTALWLIVDIIKEENPFMDFEELIKATKIVIGELIDKYHVALLDETRQKPLALEKHEILKTVENHLISLNRLPNIGDGIWFTV